MRAPHFVYEDDFLMAVEKPSGLLSVPDRWDRKEANLLDVLQGRVKAKLFVVHRLDKDTSGIVVFAKMALAHKHLSLQFERRLVHKEYVALAEGLMREDSGSLKYPLSEDPRYPGKMITSLEGKFAQTDFAVLERFPTARYTWVSLLPTTGRTHQVRVHLQCAGHPVVGDVLYGTGQSIFLSRLKKRYKLAKDQRERPLLDRLALHAHVLRFKHPKTNEQIELESPVPKDLQITLNYLRRYGA